MNELSVADFKKWNMFVDKATTGTVFSRTEYLDAIGCKYKIIVSEERGRILSGIVLAQNGLGFYTHPLYLKHLGLIIDYGDLSGVKCRSYVRKEMFKYVKLLSKIHTFDYNFSVEISDWLPFYWSGFHSQISYTYRINPLHADDWRTSAAEKIISAEKKAKKERLYFDSIITVDEVIESIVEMYRIQDARPPLNEEKMCDLLHRLTKQGLARLSCIRNESGAWEATAVQVFDSRNAFLLMTGRRKNSHSAATTFLVCNLIDRTLSEGLVFDFEGSMIKSIESFYRGFGGELTPYFKIWYPSAVNFFKRYGVIAAKLMLGLNK